MAEKFILPRHSLLVGHTVSLQNESAAALAALQSAWGGTRFQV